MPLRIIAPCLLLTACSLCTSSPSLTSSVYLGPGEHTTLRLRAVPESTLTVELQGEAGGAIAFEAHTPQGTSMASGVLNEGAQVACSTSEGELIVAFRATDSAGSVAYVARSRSGLAIALTSGR